MAWSNIFLQLTTLTGPIFGEAQVAPPFIGQIELLDFKWEMEAHKNPEASSGFSLSATGALKSLVGMGDEVQINLGKLSFKKRADIASASIMKALDNHEKILLASISILNIQNVIGPVRDVGFNLTVTDGYFSDVALRVQSSQMGAELIEDVSINFTGITMTYMRRVDSIVPLHKDATVTKHVPTIPFNFQK